MIIVDKALQRRAEEGRPIRVGLIGAGFMGRGVAQQIGLVPGITLVAIANRTPERAVQAYHEAGIEEVRFPANVAALEANIQAGHASVIDNPSLLCQADTVDAIVEATGTVEFAARTTLDALEHHKHVLLMNAELDATLGPILKAYADRAGVILSGVEGDHPGVQVNLMRFVKGLGLEPLLCGTVKSFYDPERTPATQRAYAEQWGQQPHMITSYADGTKMAFEQASVANATGLSVLKRGMLGPRVSGHAEQAMGLFDASELARLGGVVDYLVGAEPSAGVFVYARARLEAQQPYLEYLKLGPGPLYCLSTPQHLCHMEVPTSVARAVLCADAVMAPVGAPTVEVIAQAKRDLRAGERLDGIGGYTTYGVCERSSAVAKEGLLPIGLADDCHLRVDVAQHQAIRYADVEPPNTRLKDRLYAEQVATFSAVPRLENREGVI